MTDAVIVSTARTPIGKAHRGALNLTRGADLAAHAIRGALDRARLDPGAVEEVVLGCGYPENATGGNVARHAALVAGIPVDSAGVTVSRFCASGLEAIASAARRIILDGVPVAVAGGVESISLVQPKVQRELTRERLAGGAHAGDLHADDRDRRHRGGAVRHLPRGAGRNSRWRASVARPRPRSAGCLMPKSSR